MMSNMAESFNNVLRGIRRLPVTAIVAYRFSKCNTWFVDRHKFVTTALHKRERWPKRIKKELDIQKARTLGQRTTCFDFPTNQVDEQGGVLRWSAMGWPTLYSGCDSQHLYMPISGIAPHAMLPPVHCL